MMSSTQHVSYSAEGVWRALVPSGVLGSARRRKNQLGDQLPPDRIIYSRIIEKVQEEGIGVI